MTPAEIRKLRRRRFWADVDRSGGRVILWFGNPWAFWGLVLGGFILFANIYENTSTGKKSNREHECKDTVKAWVIAQGFVRDSLKAPSTAEFPSGSKGTGRSVQYEGGCNHLVHGYVDAQNGFGAMIRTNYAVEVAFDAATDTWRLESIRMN
jgi:hypothetical protein